MNNRQLIEQCQKNHQPAERELFLRFAGKVLTVCRRYTRSEHQAKDYLQECFIQLFEKIHLFDFEKGSFEGWLYRLCTNTILQQIRRDKRTVDMVYPDHMPELADELAAEWVERLTEEQMLLAIRQLPEGYRQVFNLAVMDGWSHREIADALQISESASRSQLSRAKKLLRQFIVDLIQKKHYEKRLA